MPYVDKVSRAKYNDFVIFLQGMPEISTKGDFEFLLMLLWRKFMSTREFKYSLLHDACYAVQHVADETRRRFLDKREDSARQSNGDVDL